MTTISPSPRLRVGTKTLFHSPLTPAGDEEVHRPWLPFMPGRCVNDNARLAYGAGV
jgi:hypothetical protein